MNAGRNGRVEPSELINRFFMDQVKKKRDELARVILEVAQEEDIALDNKGANELASSVHPVVSVEVRDGSFVLVYTVSIAYSAVGRGSDGSRFARAINDRLANFELGEYDQTLAPTPYRGVLMGKDELVAQALESLRCLGTIDRADGCRIMASLRSLIEWSS